MSGTFQKRGKELIEKGYSVVPIKPGGKWPNVEKWNTRGFGLADLRAYPQHGTGILTGVGANPIVAIDIDSSDPELVDRFVAWCREHLGSAPKRVGKPPKALLVYRAVESGWSKDWSGEYRDCFDEKSRLEILGAGNQFVAYHIHPGTGLPYEWDRELVRASDLTTITETQAMAAVREFDRLSVEFGHVQKLPSRTGSKKVDVPPRELPDPSNFFANVQHHAMQNLPLWVPKLFPTARSTSSGYRVSQIDLGRPDLQEALSITPDGIVDFGVHDMGDARQGKRDPIELIMEWKHLVFDVLDQVDLTPFGAAMWLCNQLNMSREELGYKPKKARMAEAEGNAIRGALSDAKAKIESCVDAVAINMEFLPFARDLVVRFPSIEPLLLKIAQERAKQLGTTIKAVEFHKAMIPAKVPTVHQRKPMTEFGNTDRMVAEYGDKVIYVPEIDQWYVWDKFHWRRAVGNQCEIEHLAQQIVRNLPNEANDYEHSAEFFQFCALSQKASMIGSMMMLLKGQGRVVVPYRMLDTHQHLLGVKNGVVDLRTGELITEVDPKWYITLTTGCEYRPGARAPIFEQTIKDVFKDNMEMVEYVMRAFGYALMGHPVEDKLFIAFGNGANGKSTVLNAVRETFGDYAKAAESSSFVSNDPKGANAGGPREDIVRLRGSRFVYVNEPDEGGELREATVKSMTGGDTITARTAYGKTSVEIKPTWVVFMPTNYKPIIKGSDNGIWRRIDLIPFERNFTADPTIADDKQRKNKILAEKVGILALLVNAALRYQKVGLTSPPAIREAREQYRSDMDMLAEWLSECCEIDPKAATPIGVLWKSWEGHAKDRGLLNYIRSSSALSRRLDTRFPAIKTSDGTRLRSGIRLKIVGFEDVGDLFQ